MLRALLCTKHACMHACMHVCTGHAHVCCALLHPSPLARSPLDAICLMVRYCSAPSHCIMRSTDSVLLGSCLSTFLLLLTMPTSSLCIPTQKHKSLERAHIGLCCCDCVPGIFDSRLQCLRGNNNKRKRVQADRYSGVDTSLPPKLRILGGSVTGSEIITGVLLQQKRQTSGSDCNFRFSKLKVVCLLDETTKQHILQQEEFAPFGREPAFNPAMPAYDPELTGKEGAFFNVSAGSDEMAHTGFPFAFFPRTMKGLRGTLQGFPVVFEVRKQACRLSAQGGNDINGNDIIGHDLNGNPRRASGHARLVLLRSSSRSDTQKAQCHAGKCKLSRSSARPLLPQRCSILGCLHGLTDHDIADV